MGAEDANEILLRRAVLDEADHRVSPCFGVFDIEIVAIDPQEMPHCFECGSFVTLLEWMRPCYPGLQRYCQDENVLFTECKEIGNYQVDVARASL